MVGRWVRDELMQNEQEEVVRDDQVHADPVRSEPGRVRSPIPPRQSCPTSSRNNPPPTNPGSAAQHDQSTSRPRNSHRDSHPPSRCTSPSSSRTEPPPHEADQQQPPPPATSPDERPAQTNPSSCRSIASFVISARTINWQSDFTQVDNRIPAVRPGVFNAGQHLSWWFSKGRGVQGQFQGLSHGRTPCSSSSTM